MPDTATTHLITSRTLWIACAPDDERWLSATAYALLAGDGAAEHPAAVYEALGDEDQRWLAVADQAPDYPGRREARAAYDGATTISEVGAWLAAIGGEMTLRRVGSAWQCAAGGQVVRDEAPHTAVYECIREWLHHGDVRAMTARRAA